MRITSADGAIQGEPNGRQNLLATSFLPLPFPLTANSARDEIGISNVHKRPRALYGGDFQMDISSREGEGTRIRIEVTELIPAESHSPAPT